jgi:hypothetical protein
VRVAAGWPPILRHEDPPKCHKQRQDGAFHEATRRILGVLLGLNRIYDHDIVRLRSPPEERRMGA